MQALFWHGIGTYKAMFNKSACGRFIQFHGGLFRLGFQGLDLLKVLPHAGQLAEYWVLLRIDTLEAQVCCKKRN
jgi:hypothetical protein